MKLWDKGKVLNHFVDEFTAGNDRELDLFLAGSDIIGSLAHIEMLKEIGLLNQDEWLKLSAELRTIYKEVQIGKFVIENGVEDVHSQIELMLTRKLGGTGKKIHSGRSRNDQVLLDLKLFTRDNLQKIVKQAKEFFDVLIASSERYKEVIMPGYTHLQIAMPSSFGLWFAAYAESLVDDMRLLAGAYEITNQNPLGSGAGYGSSFPLDRQRTTDLMGFDSMNVNVIYAQMGRGKTERIVVQALGSIAATISKFAVDCCLFMSQNFGFISLPDEFTTGSSIMPHKKNPDVFELLRAKCNKVQALANEISLISNNLSSGYFRDLQVIKESYLPVFAYLSNCIEMATLITTKIEVSSEIMKDEKYKFIFSVEELNMMVLSGVPFRDAYKTIAQNIENNKFNPNRKLNHTHQGSINNLCNDLIVDKMEKNLERFPFNKVASAIQKLLEG